MCKNNINSMMLGKEFGIYKASIIYDAVKYNNIEYTDKIRNLIDYKLRKLNDEDQKLFLYLLKYIDTQENSKLIQFYNTDYEIFNKIILLPRRKASVKLTEQYAFDTRGVIQSAYDYNPRAKKLQLFQNGMDEDEKEFLCMDLENSIIYVNKYI